MHEKKKKLDENAILKRLSNGAMYQVYGGKSVSLSDPGDTDDDDDDVAPELGDCLAGCGCKPLTACDTCLA